MRRPSPFARGVPSRITEMAKGGGRVSWLTTFWGSRRWPLGRGVSCRICEQADSMVDPPGAQRPHAVLNAYLLQRAIRRLSVCVVIQMAFAHELIQRVVDQRTTHERQGVNGRSGWAIPCIALGQ